jgi:hypothetical protein
MNENIVWSTLLNDRYLVKVTRTEPYMAQLTIAYKGEILHRQETELMFDAVFGADSSDIRSWQQSAMDFLEGRHTQLRAS